MRGSRRVPGGLSFDRADYKEANPVYPYSQSMPSFVLGPILSHLYNYMTCPELAWNLFSHEGSNNTMLY